MSAVSTTTVGCIEVKVTDNIDKWSQITEQNYKSAIRAMADSIRNLSTMVAPKKTGALRDSGRVDTVDEYTLAVRYGSREVPYARRMEYGNPAWNYTTPGTGPHYLQRSGDMVSKRGIKEYLR